MMNTMDLSAVPRVPSPTQRVHGRHHPLVGGLMVKEGLINQVQLDKVLALQRETEPRPLLGQMLVDQKLVTPHELNAILAKYQRMDLLGDVLIETRAITPAQLERALAIQRRTHTALGDTLVQLGLITERALKQALGIQLRIPFVGLDDRSIDAGMAAVISERYARHHRAIPIAEMEGRIVLAMDDPTDVEVVAEIRLCTGRQIDVVVTTADALERAFARLYGQHGGADPAHHITARVDEAPVPEPTERTMHAADPLEPDASRPVRGATSERRDGERTAPGAALEAIRARTEHIRYLVRSWEGRTDTVESLVRERLARRADIERLTSELQEARSALARASHDLEAKTEALTRLEMTHAAALRERDQLGDSLSDLRERCAALLQERQVVIDRVTEALRRLRA
jgi:hypothetical protein